MKRFVKRGGAMEKRPTASSSGAQSKTKMMKTAMGFCGGGRTAEEPAAERSRLPAEESQQDYADLTYLLGGKTQRPHIKSWD